MEGIPGGINTFLRYTYAGFLVAWPIWDIWPDKIKGFLEFREITGGALVSLGLVVVLALGVLFHAVYRVLLGELFLYPFTEYLCRKYPRINGWQIAPCRTLMYRLEFEYKIQPRGVRRQANRLIRAKVFSENFRRRVDIRQGEVHVLYMTVVFLSFVLFLSLFNYYITVGKMFGPVLNYDMTLGKIFASITLFVLLAFAWIASVLTHIWQDSLEGDYMTAREAQDGGVKRLLREAKYLDRRNEPI